MNSLARLRTNGRNFNWQLTFGPRPPPHPDRLCRRGEGKRRIVTLIAEGLGRGRFVSFCAQNFLHFALQSCYILGQKLLQFALMLNFFA